MVTFPAKGELQFSSDLIKFLSLSYSRYVPCDLPEYTDVEN